MNQKNVDLLEQGLGAYADRCEPSALTVEAIVGGGRRRVRRRRAAQAVGGLGVAAAVAFGGSALLGGLTGPPTQNLPGATSTQPSPAPSSVWSGCTLQPQSCDLAGILQAWGGRVSPVTLPNSGWHEASPGLWSMTGITGRVGNRPFTLDVRVSATGRDAVFADPRTKNVATAEYQIEGAPTWQAASLDGSEMTWVVPALPGHGAIQIVVNGRSAVEGSPPTQTDLPVNDLLTALLGSARPAASAENAAITAARDHVFSWDKARRAGRTESYRSTFAPSCGSCVEQADQIDTSGAAGVTIRGGEVALDGIQIVSSSGSTVVLTARQTTRNGDYVNAQGDAVASFGGGLNTITLTLKRAGDGNWIVVDLLREAG